MSVTSPKKTTPEEGVFFIGEPTKERGEKTWFDEVELEPLEGEEDAGNFRVRIGDDVIVDNDEFDHEWVVRVTELFIDRSNRQAPARFKGRWYYRIEDTLLMVTHKDNTMELPIDNNIGRREGLEGRRVWLAEEDDNEAYNTDNPIGAIIRLATVKHINPGDSVPDVSECDFWYNQTHSRKFYTFKDYYKKPSSERKNPLRRLNVLDLFCGCGGLSFLDQKGSGVEIKTTHAVDMDADALRTYATNHPDVQTHLSCVEEFLFLCKHFDRLACKLEIPKEVELSPSKRQRLEESVEVTKIVSIELKHSVKKIADGQGEGQLEQGLTMSNSWLVFTCRQKDGKEVKMKEKDVLQNEAALRSFVMSCKLPRPGDIQVIVGGPPCQGISGLNRHAHQKNVLSCHRNGLVKSFFRTIEHFQPEFTLMENVQDMMKKEDGAYAKYATAQLLALGYQSRLGIIAAGCHGAAQHRYRCFLWGARSGKALLPPFPQPVFRATLRKNIAVSGKSCEVDFLTDEDRKNAYPEVLNEDILTDLPEVSNFRLSDNARYKCKPLRPIQAWLRRTPDENELDLEARATRADEMMKATRKLVWEHVRAKKVEAQRQGVEEAIKVADLVLCQVKDDRKNDFAAQIRTEYLKIIDALPDAEEKRKELEDWKIEMMKEHGSALLDALEEMTAICNNDSELVRDHRPRLCNSDDYYRITQVPKGPGKNFRDMPGVIVTDKGTCCAGHTHAFKGHGCPGGGTAPLPKRSIYKESRIDHADKDGWRGLKLDGCPSRTYFTPTLNLVCPRWCITYKNGLSSGRHGCFGRVRLDSVQPTVVTRAEPHNLEICHPFQDRVLSIREMARCQGFPDHYIFVGTDREGAKRKTFTRLNCVENRYKQIGNAVAPPVAAALGRCLLLAAAGQIDPHQPVIRTRDEDMVEVFAEAKKNGLQFYAEELGGPRRSATTADDESSDNESIQDL